MPTRCRQRKNPEATEYLRVMTAQHFACSAVPLRRLVFGARTASFSAMWLLLVMLTFSSASHAQRVVLEAPTGANLPNLTPRFTVRAFGFPASTQLRYTVYITLNSTGDGPYLQTLSTTTTDSVASLLVKNLLPSEAKVYWKARVEAITNGSIAESPISGPHQAPRWLKLITLNSDSGNQVNVRRPTFTWESGAIDPEYGSWRYAIAILIDNVPKITTSDDLTETTFVPPTELNANTPYKWQVTATVTPTGESVQVVNRGTFFIVDRALPTTTLLYQNFPNPFPSPTSFVTCFWFDVQTGGSRISLDIVDLRGTLVKTIVPSTQFAAGIYGRGPVGAASNCDNRFVWDGTATDGRSVSGGVYLARFLATGRQPAFKKIVFRGR